MKNTKLTVTLHIGGNQIENLSPEQQKKISQKLSEQMSTFYTAHPEEFIQIKK